MRLALGSVHDLYELATPGARFVLCHYPLLFWNHQRAGAINLFGHVHTDWRGASGQVNIGVDQWDFCPVDEARVEVEALTLPAHGLFNG